MLCTYCGTDNAPTLVRCHACGTPLPLAPLPDTDRGEGMLPSSWPDTLVLEDGQLFARRYTIVRLLGSGGMGTVYQAWDSVLGDEVALKLIRVRAGARPADVGELHDRFKRELKLARHVSHPNVIRIHD